MPSILVIEDEETLARNIARFLEHSGWDVQIAGTAEEGLERVSSAPPDIVMLDFGLPDMDGLAALAILRKRDPQMSVVMLTGQANVQLAVDAMKSGAVDFIAKPVVLADLKRVLERLVREKRLSYEVAYHQARNSGNSDALVGRSPGMLALKDLVSRVVRVEPADGSSPPAVLITGETGSGKELVARACHGESPRFEGPFIELNCAAIPANLMESELFGHERGAFTDARERKIGLIEAADGGTLFLDEIGEMDLALQAKLLRVLDSHRVRRLGSLQERRINVRVIAATNQLLDRRVAEGHFRADLLHRLRVIEIKVPTLRERGEDVALLARHFLDQFGGRYAKPGIDLAPAALKLLQLHDWPGNVRELRNVIEQAVLVARDRHLEPADLYLPASLSTRRDGMSASIGTGGNEQVSSLSSMERDQIRLGLEKSGWNITRAASLLGVSRDTLRYRMERHCLARPVQGAVSA